MEHQNYARYNSKKKKKKVAVVPTFKNFSIKNNGYIYKPNNVLISSEMVAYKTTIMWKCKHGTCVYKLHATPSRTE